MSSAVSVLCVAAVAFAGLSRTPQAHAVVAPTTVTGIRMAAVKAVSKCAGAPSVTDCLSDTAVAGVRALAESSDPIELVPGYVTLVKNDDDADGRPDGLDLKRSADDINAVSGPSFVDSAMAFVKSRAISLKAPADVLESLKTTVMQARGKKDKYAGPLLMGAMMVAGTLLPIKLGALAMMSGKALMTSVIALMLAAILALKKLASGGGGHSATTYEVINVPSHTGHGHGRSLAHSLAYGIPVNVTTAVPA
ncbi:uncharacterized protein LOC126843028 [Adelges cooleyi]|uniref:uncharacterized protein LOC126843028 n=1 Tax=Adelges cooleyi TaxID=133065 RepID=UPI00218028C0|nr:uncharacterized protein LOC126843028 [Adelges cooleyi]